MRIGAFFLDGQRMTLVAFSTPLACLIDGVQPSSLRALSEVYGFPPRQNRTADRAEPG